MILTNFKIAIIGTRGIPNHYGGFEQFAESLSVFLANKGHEVIVYNSENHPYKKTDYKGVKIIHKKDPEKRIGTVGQFFYDLYCILDTRKRNLDIILQLGYTSSSIWSFLFPKKPIIVTNMDGLEWKRTKFSLIVQKFLLFAEKKAVKKSTHLVSDSKGIQNYINTKYNVKSTYIAYGTDILNKANVSLIENFELVKKEYDLLIARIEPENNIKMVIEGYLLSKSKKKLIVVGDYTINTFGKSLYAEYAKNPKIKFLGSIYDKEVINNLRYYCNIYFHGHSVGGTNPSLLEAMGCSCLILAHKNQFNSSVLEKDAYYFDSAVSLSKLIDTTFAKDEILKVNSNLEKIRNYYNSTNINNLYETLFFELLKKE